jgi:hypothetical protein
MPTPTYVAVSNFVKGVVAAETGINISDYRQGFTDEKMFIEDKSGSPTGFVHNFLVASTCTITGEVNTATNVVLGAKFGITEVIANAITGYDKPGTSSPIVVGSFFLDDIEITQSRGSLATATANFTRHPDIIVAPPA